MPAARSSESSRSMALLRDRLAPPPDPPSANARGRVAASAGAKSAYRWCSAEQTCMLAVACVQPRPTQAHVGACTKAKVTVRPTRAHLHNRANVLASDRCLNDGIDRLCDILHGAPPVITSLPRKGSRTADTCSAGPKHPANLHLTFVCFVLAISSSSDCRFSSLITRSLLISAVFRFTLESNLRNASSSARHASFSTHPTQHLRDQACALHRALHGTRSGVGTRVAQYQATFALSDIPANCTVRFASRSCRC